MTVFSSSKVHTFMSNPMKKIQTVMLYDDVRPFNPEDTFVHKDLLTELDIAQQILEFTDLKQVREYLEHCEAEHTTLPEILIWYFRAKPPGTHKWGLPWGVDHLGFPIIKRYAVVYVLPAKLGDNRIKAYKRYGKKDNFDGNVTAEHLLYIYHYLLYE
jgi:hypothetical protein